MRLGRPAEIAGDLAHAADLELLQQRIGVDRLARGDRSRLPGDVGPSGCAIGLRYSSQTRWILGRIVRAANSSLGKSDEGTTTSASTSRNGTFSDLGDRFSPDLADADRVLVADDDRRPASVGDRQRDLGRASRSGRPAGRPGPSGRRGCRAALDQEPVMATLGLGVVGRQPEDGQDRQLRGRCRARSRDSGPGCRRPAGLAASSRRRIGPRGRGRRAGGRGCGGRAGGGSARSGTVESSSSGRPRPDPPSGQRRLAQPRRGRRRPRPGR